MHRPKTGLLLVNLGTPEAPTAQAVRPYLREFLMDARVITIPGPMRWMLVNGIIAPFRAPKSAHAYESIWWESGSPLLVISEQLTEKVRARLPSVPVELSMRYGEPSIGAGLEKLVSAGAERVIVFPLYPQAASATTGSVVQKVMDELREWWSIPAVCVVPPFYDHDAFIDAQVTVGRPHLDELKPDHVVFSFHGVPEDHVLRSDRSGAHCLKSDDCCAQLTETNRFCYRAQCHATGRALAKALDLKDDAYTITFQSRLGRAEWIKPYTAATVEALARAGTKKLAVFCPAFVADCLETLEEIGVEAAGDFKANGGEAFIQIPCVNAHDAWADGVVQLTRESCNWLPAEQEREDAPPQG
jgi:ferrochelatase